MEIMSVISTNKSLIVMLTLLAAISLNVSSSPVTVDGDNKGVIIGGDHKGNINIYEKNKPLEYIKWNDGNGQFFVTAATIEPSCWADRIDQKHKFKLSIKNGKVILFSMNDQEIPATLSKDRKILIINGGVRVDEGITTFKNGNIYLRNDNKIDANLKWTWREDSQNGMVCTGTLFITESRKMLFRDITTQSEYKPPQYNEGLPPELRALIENYESKGFSKENIFEFIGKLQNFEKNQ